MSAEKTLTELREDIRNVDEQLISILNKRITLATQIMDLKRKDGLSVIDPDAEQNVLNNLLSAGKRYSIEEKVTRQLAEVLIEASVEAQRKVATTPSVSGDQLLKGILEEVLKLKARGLEVIRMEIGEPNFPTPRRIIHSAQKALSKKLIGYGPVSGLSELREVISAKLAEEYECKLNPDRIVVTPGGRFGIFAAISTNISSLERVIIPQPAWPAYEENVNFVGGRPIAIPTRLEGGWEIDLGLLEDEIKKGARMLILNSPSNPTGKAIGSKTFNQIVDLAVKYNIPIISDEAYSSFSFDHTPSILERPECDYIYVNTFSKEFGITGWRIAYVIAGEKRIARIRRLMSMAITCVPEFIQRAAVTAIKSSKREAQVQVEKILKKVRETCEELDKIDVSYYRPDGGFYIFPKGNQPGFDSVEFSKHLISKYRVAVTPGLSFGSYQEFFRMAISISRREIKPGVKAIGEAMQTWRK